jgi:hypothetical protein
VAERCLRRSLGVRTRGVDWVHDREAESPTRYQHATDFGDRRREVVDVM